MSRLNETTLLLDQEAGVSLKTEPAAKTSTRRRGVAVAVSTLAILAIGADNTNQTIINKVNKINGMVNEFAAIETKPGSNDNWNTAGPVVAPGDGDGVVSWPIPGTDTPPFSVGPCVKNPDGGTDC